MNRLNLARRTQVASALVEGNSIPSTERMTGVHRDTIMRLMVEVGTGCAAIMGRPNVTMRMSMRPVYSPDQRLFKEDREHAGGCGASFRALHFLRMHKSLRMTPAMAAGVESNLCRCKTW